MERTLKQVNGRRLILVLLLLVVVVGVVRRSVGTFSVVNGSSMYPTFQPDDVVRARPISDALTRGDIVILSDYRGDKVIKRIVGMPGETVTIYRGFVYIGQQRLHEPYLARRTYTFNSNPQNERAVVWHLKADQYFVLGDNRFESCDSRHYGPVQAAQLSQRVALPDNAMGPDFTEIVITRSGKVSPVKSLPVRHSTDNSQARLNARI